MTAGYNMGVDPSGREHLVVVIKGTFVLPRIDETVRLHDEQQPLVMADTFTGAPGFSAPLLEIDFAQRKRHCDVMLCGSAHAPAGREVARMRVRMRVGPMDKAIDVVGDRVWQAGLAGIGASSPQPFTRMPISYDRAFGGVDPDGDEDERGVYGPNPVGRGFHSRPGRSNVDGAPLPNTEEPGQEVLSPRGPYTPMALGPIGRNWPQRARYAGTYDQAWVDDVFPFLPKDFDERYYQAAPEEQQLPPPAAPLEVSLEGLTPDGTRRFLLPHFEAPICVFPKTGGREDHAAVLDTIVFEPDHDRFTMAWRLTRPLRRSMFEISQVLVGRKGRDWWQKREQAAFPIPVVMVPMAPKNAEPA